MFKGDLTECSNAQLSMNASLTYKFICHVLKITQNVAYKRHQTIIGSYPPPDSKILQDNPIIEHNYMRCNNIFGLQCRKQMYQTFISIF